MSGQSEDDVWRSIVENYGERPEVEPLAEEPAPDEPAPEELAPAGRRFAPDDDLHEPDDRFVPPVPPAFPPPPPARFAAWLGVFGAPTVLLVALVLGIPLPGWIAYGLVASFVGGFGYLVVHMQRGPRDPGDDGAVV